MNKKELIDNINNLESESDSSDYQLGFEKAKYWCLTLAGYLVESEAEKVAVPDYVAEWYESHRGDLEYDLFVTTVAINNLTSKDDEAFEKWFDSRNTKPYETIIKMKLFGYTVKPKRWVVKNKEHIGLESFVNSTIKPVWTTEEPLWMAFTDKSKAEAVATLVEGSVEEV